MSFSFAEFDQKVLKAKQHLQQDLATLRTGKATSQMLDPVVVEAYGTQLKIHEVATVSAPDPHLLMVTPWDKGLMPALEKAIASAGLNLNPVVDGQIIRIVVPSLTEERRKEMVKMLHQKIEAGKVMVRNIRMDTKKDIDRLKDQAGVSEDEVETHLNTLEEKMKVVLTDLDTMASAKETELMTV